MKKKMNDFRTLSFLNAVMVLFLLEPFLSLSLSLSRRVCVDITIVCYIRHAIRLFVFVAHRLCAQYALTAFFSHAIFSVHFFLRRSVQMFTFVLIIVLILFVYIHILKATWILTPDSNEIQCLISFGESESETDCL